MRVKIPTRVRTKDSAPGDIALVPIKLTQPDAGIIRRAVEARASYGLHFYDGTIVAAAEQAGCQRIWSEDLNAGQKYFGITVANPFSKESSS